MKKQEEAHVTRELTPPATEPVMGVAIHAATASAPAIAGAAAAAKAEIEAAYAIAVHRPRNLMDARQRILATCSRPRFAANVSAVYRKPVGGGQVVEGPGIRVAEEFARSMGNIRAMSEVRRDDDEVREVVVWVTDLETNTTFSEPVSLRRTLERRTVRDGQVVIGQRETSQGNTVYIVRATDDEMAIKTKAGVSKALRNCILRLMPQDVIEDAVERIKKIRRAQIDEDPLAASKKLADAFGRLGVKPSDLEVYLGRPLQNASTGQLDELRSIYAAIRDEETTWAAVIDNKTGGGTREKGTLKPEDLSPPGDSGGPPKRTREPADNWKGIPEQITAYANAAGWTPVDVRTIIQTAVGDKRRSRLSKADIATVMVAMKQRHGAVAHEGAVAPNGAGASAKAHVGEAGASQPPGNGPTATKPGPATPAEPPEEPEIEMPSDVRKAKEAMWVPGSNIVAYCKEHFDKEPSKLTKPERVEVITWIMHSR